MEVLPATNQFNIGFGYEKVSEGVWGSVDALRRRLEEELRAAKGRLAVGEVIVPANLLPSVALACLDLADHEPCGARGATLFLSLRDERLPEPTPLATLKLDHSTVSTFELHLTLHHTAPAWTHLLPHFLKNLAGNGTMVISPQFTLTKKKLYRSYQQD